MVKGRFTASFGAFPPHGLWRKDNYAASKGATDHPAPGPASHGTRRSEWQQWDSESRPDQLASR